MTHYDALGLERDATAEEITHRYRLRSKQLHPDRNPGDATAAEAYRRVQEAYEVLSDPERRKRYDETGDSAPRREEDQELRLFLIPALLRSIHECTGEHGLGVERTDLVSMMVADLLRQQSQVEKAMEDMRRDERTLKEVLTRLKTEKDTTNVFEEPLRSQLKEIAQGLVKAKSDLDKLQRALNYLKKCKYAAGAFGALVTELPPYHMPPHVKKMLGIGWHEEGGD